MTVALLVLGCISAAEPASGVIEAYRKSLSVFSSARYEMKAIWHYQGVASASELQSQTDEYRSRRDPNRWKTQYRGSGITFFKGQQVDWTIATEYLHRPDGYVYVQQSGNETGLMVGATFEVARAKPIEMSLGPGCCLLGFLPGDGGVRLDDVLKRGGATVSSSQLVDGKETLLLECKSNLGTHRVWFDRSAGGWPRRIEVHKRAADLYDGRSLSAEPLRPAGIMVPDTPFEEFTVVIENVAIDERGRAWTDFQQTITHRHQGGKEAVFRIEHKLIDLELSPSFSDEDFEIEMDIPEGTAVNVEESPQLEYRWQDGWPRKFVDRGSLPSASTDEFKTDGSGSRHTWVFFLSSLAAVALAAWFAYRRVAAPR